MKKKILSVVILLFTAFVSYCQKGDVYQVYALGFNESDYMQVQDIAVGATERDSVRVCNMFWFLKGENGRNILVDAGFLDSANVMNESYERPDLVLKKINVYPSDITDIIITHPHPDHIGGINLFPNARVWMQKEDFDYFVGGAWQENEFSAQFTKNDVRNLIEINLQGRLKLVKGDNIEIIPGIKVFIGSKHTFENQYLLVSSETESILIASDAVWFYYNLNNLLPIPKYTSDPKAYVEAMKRMKTLVANPDLIIPGHDDLVFSKFPEICKGVVKIGD